MVGIDNALLLRRFCQVAAVAESNKLEETLDWLVVVMMVYDDGPWRSADDWYEAIETAFGMDLALTDIQRALQRAVEQKKMHRSSFRDEYVLSEEIRTEAVELLDAADDLEMRIRNRWLDRVRPAIGETLSEKAWGVLQSYASRAFRLHGADAMELLTGEASGDSAGERRSAILEKALAEHNLPKADHLPMTQAIDLFFTQGDIETSRYVSQLADSTFSLMALTIDEGTRAELATRLPPLNLFLDTNVLFALLGTHDTPLAAASVDLVRVIRENDLPFKLICFDKTLSELEHTLEGALARLQKQTWSQTVSRALLKIPYQVSRLSGIETKFHQLNAETSISPATYCSRFANSMALLETYGVKIYRENPAKDTPTRLEFRSTIIDLYREYLEKNHARRTRYYEKLDHDASVWVVAKDHQTPSNKGPLHVGSFAVTTDYAFWRFDRSTMRHEFSTRPVVVLPDMLLQALRPFIGKKAGIEEQDFGRIFATAEWRVGGVTDVSQILQRVAAYLATFQDLPEDTAVRILTDSLLLQRIKKIESDGASLGDAVDQAVVLQNEELRRDRDALIEERSLQQDQVAKALDAMQSGDGGAQRAVLLLKELVSQEPPVTQSTSISIGSIYLEGTGMKHTGDIYNNKDTQVAAQGPGSSGIVHEQNMDNRKVDFGDGQLLAELEEVKVLLLSRATRAEDYSIVSAVQGAIESSEQSSHQGVLESLKKAGRKALDVATEIGAKFAVEAIKASMP